MFLDRPQQRLSLPLSLLSLTPVEISTLSRTLTLSPQLLFPNPLALLLPHPLRHGGIYSLSFHHENLLILHPKTLWLLVLSQRSLSLQIIERHIVTDFPNRLLPPLPTRTITRKPWLSLHPTTWNPNRGPLSGKKTLRTSFADKERESSLWITPMDQRTNFPF